MATSGPPFPLPLSTKMVELAIIKNSIVAASLLRKSAANIVQFVEKLVIPFNLKIKSNYPIERIKLWISYVSSFNSLRI